MRPASHREYQPTIHCANCRFGAVPLYKDYLLCFHGDNATIEREDTGKATVILNGEDVSFMEGDEFDRVWGGRVVDCNDVCNEWEAQC